MKWQISLYLTIISILFSASSRGQSPAILDLLIKNTLLIDVVNKKTIPHQYIGIRGRRIVSISSTAPRMKAKRIIDGTNKAILPGFINTHTHLWQHICKSCIPQGSLQKWISIYRVVHYLQPEELRKVVLAASNEALLTGITTVSDYASLSFNEYGFGVNAQAIHDAGIGGVVIWHNPSIFLPDRIKIEEIRRYQAKFNRQLNIWMGAGPLSFHSLSQVYSGIQLADSLNLSLSEHTMENNQEQKDLYDMLQKYIANYGSLLTSDDQLFFKTLLQNAKRPSDNDAFQALLESAKGILDTDQRLISEGTAVYKPLTESEKNIIGVLPAKRNISPLEILNHWKALPHFLSIHSVWPQAADIAIMKQQKVAISHNPESNLYLTSGLAPIQEYFRSGLTVSLGTDGAASNDGIDFFSAMRSMWNIAKIKSMNTDVSRNLDEWTVLQTATISGAKSLKIDSLTGSIEIGKEADLILIALDELGLAPVQPLFIDGKISTASNLPAVLIYSASPRNVKYVISDGTLLVNDGKLTRYNEHVLAKDLTHIARVSGKRKEIGQTWKTRYSIQNSKTPYWYRYRSVRIIDSIDIQITNSTKTLTKLTIAASGTTFGGGSPYMIDSAVLRRYPTKPNPVSFLETITLTPGQHIEIKKGKGRQGPENNSVPKPFHITINGISKEYPFQNEQLLVLAESLHNTIR